jgi:hypothetical protein
MSNHRDHKAEFGYSPTWDRQREKQQTVADNRDRKLDIAHRECKRCPASLRLGKSCLYCPDCGYEEPYEPDQ